MSNTSINNTNSSSASGALENDTINAPDLYAPTITATADQFAEYLINGFWADFGTYSRHWNTSESNIVTYSISSEFTAAQHDGLQMAFESWSDVANIQFLEVSSDANIAVLEGDDGSAWSGQTSGYLVDNVIEITTTTISIDTDQWFWNNINEVGDYALMTAIHEIGHAIGLGHPGNYNGSATYDNDAIFTNDTHQYSLMSYFGAYNTGANHQGEYPSTPMIYDIYAAQQIYGANMDTRAGDTVYGFNSNAGSSQFNFTINIRPVIAIWDGNGNDTIDVSEWSNNQTINLNDGEFSHVGGGTGNLAIAINAVIENAIGGSGNDTFYGNEVANILTGNAGDDVFYASLGDDTIYGGEGSDTIRYDYDFQDVTITPINAQQTVITHEATGLIHTIHNVENYVFNGVSYTHAELPGTVSISSILLNLGNNGDNPWNIRHTNNEVGYINLFLDDIVINDQPSLMFVYRRSETQLSVWSTNFDTQNYLGMGNDIISDIDVRDIANVDLNLSSHNDVAVRLSNVQYGTTNTSNGNDFVSIIGSLENAGASTVYRVNTGNGNDQINYTGHNGLTAVLNAGEGDDTIRIQGDARTFAYGFGGDDTIDGGADNDFLYGELGNDELYGGGGNDYLYGSDGDDLIQGQDGDDRVYAGNHNDTIYGGIGNDGLHGDAGNDIIYGEDGSDYLNGGSGHDRLEGGAGIDHLYGGGGDDVLIGGSGYDKLVENGGNDTLIGIGDGDVMYGNQNADTFGLIEWNGIHDRYFDFNLTEGDNLNITDVLQGYTHGTDDINDFVYFRDRGSSFTDMHISVNGDGHFVRAAQIFDSNTLDGLSVDDLIASNDLIVDSTLI